MRLQVPTQLTEEQISEFQRIYFKRYDEEISREDAIDEGLSLIRLVAIVINKDDQQPSILKG